MASVMDSKQYVYIFLIGYFASAHLFQLNHEFSNTRPNINGENQKREDSDPSSDGVEKTIKTPLTQRVEMLEDFVTDMKKENENIKSELTLLKERLQRADLVIENLLSKLSDTDARHEPMDSSDHGVQMDQSEGSMRSSNMISSNQIDNKTPKRDLKIPVTKIPSHRIQKRDVSIRLPQPINTFTYRATPTITDKPAFTAYLQDAITQVSPNQHIIFDKVVSNVDSLYNARSGMVTCKVPGIYVFYHALDVNIGHSVNTIIVKNAEIMGFAVCLGNDMVSVMVAIPLVEGDEVWVQAYNPTNGAQIDSVFTSFSGFLI